VIIAGVSAGGGALVASSGTVSVDELHNGVVGTPQQGDLEDVTARQFFSERGFVTREQGGEFQLNPAANLDLLPLFLRQGINAVWTTEPWVSALVDEAKGRILVRDDDLWRQANGGGPDVSMVVVAPKILVQRHPEIIDGFLTAHVSLVNAVRAGGPDDRQTCAGELSRFVGRSFSDAAMASAWSRVRFSAEIPRDAVTRHAYAAFRVGFLGREIPDLNGAVVDEPLSRALAASH
jgi:NitT/TauT family transport system substrate-binding protein